MSESTRDFEGLPKSPTKVHPNWSVDADGNIGPGYGQDVFPAETAAVDVPAGKHKKAKAQPIEPLGA